MQINTLLIIYYYFFQKERTNLTLLFRVSNFHLAIRNTATYHLCSISEMSSLLLTSITSSFLGLQCRYEILPDIRLLPYHSVHTSAANWSYLVVLRTSRWLQIVNVDYSRMHHCTKQQWQWPSLYFIHHQHLTNTAYGEPHWTRLIKHYLAQ